MHRTTRTIALLAASLGLLATAVVSTGGRPVGAASAFAPRLAFPMTISSPAGSIVLKKAPIRIISLSPTATEDLFAIGAGRQVAAVDLDANYPAHGLPKTRFDAFTPNVEAIIALKPDLVIVSYNPDNLEAQLAAAGIPVLEQDAASTTQDTYQQITWLGDATGHYAKSLAVAKGIEATIAQDVARVPARHAPLSIYFELDPTYYYSLTSTTYAGSLLKDLGVTNIADAASTTLDAGYPQLSAEYVINANPGVIFLADTICCKQTLSTVKKRPGFALLAAVKHKLVFGLDDDVASRWGPRVSVLMNDLTADVLLALKTLKK
jgi:iron complex transport system substrate-binding protein